MKKTMWKLKQSADSAESLDIYIYGDVEGDYFDWWTRSMVESQTSAEHFRQELAKYPDAKQINLYINSYGGSVFEGTAIYNQLRRHPAHKTVYIDGFACSIASVIAMVGDEIIMPRNALMMIHNMWLSACGNATELRKAADDLDTINAAGRGAYLERAGEKLDEKQLIEMMDQETWLTADQCIQYGLADRYAEQDADMSGAAQVLQKANLDLQQRIQIQKGMAAQLRQLVQPEPQTGPEPGSEPEPKNSKKSDKSLMTLISRL